jgi:hypothetical protein
LCVAGIKASVTLQFANQRTDIDAQMLRRLAFAAAQFHRLEDDLAFELLDLKFEVLLGALIGGALNDGGLQSLACSSSAGK